MKRKNCMHRAYLPSLLLPYLHFVLSLPLQQIFEAYALWISVEKEYLQMIYIIMIHLDVSYNLYFS